ncbi:PUA-like domain-containing protein [Mycena amicta]|nr:PUA-like domain-containing protein [Mycena amicta]
MVSAYEKQRLANIQRNKALLLSLGLDKPVFEPTEIKRVERAKSSKKRKAVEQPDTHSEHAPKAARTDAVSGPLRRSARTAGKSIDYKAEKQSGSPLPISFKSGLRSLENCGPLGRGEGEKRIHNPKVYGPIPGVEIGTWWETRAASSALLANAPSSYLEQCMGAFSVALSGGYEDDVDCGSGGRDLKGTKANPKNASFSTQSNITAPQTSDQTFENNKSSQTKKPIRVIRGFKLKSPYAPYEGYRYDGLYCIEKVTYFFLLLVPAHRCT